ncbi:MAG: Cas10/Cmr2 second palm domain-containing protein [Thermodesulfovibrionales bacterium]
MVRIPYPKNQKTIQTKGAQFILSAEIESIQKYIVTSNRMWTIRAGSYILDRFNEDIREEFKKNKILGGRLIFSSAGSIKAIFDNKTSAENYGKEIAKELRDRTEIASLTWVVEEIKDNNISDALKNVEKRIQEKRSKKETPVSIINHPLFYDCEICKSYPATSKIKKDKEYLVCQSCFLKFHSESKFLPIYEDLNRKRRENRKLFDDFDKLVGDDYLALIYSDGNRLGEHLINLSKNQDAMTLTLLKEFSEKLDLATHKAFKETVNDVFKEFFNSDKRHFPFMVIVLGGDDMTVAMPARYAFIFAKTFSEKFVQETKNFGSGLPEVSVSIGIAIAKHTFPFSNLYEVAEELQKNAKRLSRWIRENNKKGEYSTVDFEIITQSLSEEITERRRSLDFGNYIATGRPYLLGDGDYPFRFEELYEKSKKLKEAGVSNSFINSLYDIVKDPSTMRVELDIKLKRLYVKPEEITHLLNDYKEIRKNFDEKPSLPILDVAEVFNYIGE